MLLKRFKEFNLSENTEIEFTLDDVDDKKSVTTEQPREKSTESTVDAKENTVSKDEKLNADIKKLPDETGNTSDILKRAKDESVESLNIKGLTQESDIYDFYLAHQFEIDEKLNETDFFTESMESRGINGLYNAVIIGTQFAIKKTLEELK